MEDEFDGLTVVDLAIRLQWDVALRRARRFPQELVEKNQDGQNAVHLAVVNAAPLPFSSVLRIESEYIKEACMAKDYAGWTPLMYASFYFVFVGLERLQALVEACPEAVGIKDSLGSSCLHHLCYSARSTGGFSGLRRALARAEILVQVEPSLCRHQDDSGKTPIHVLFEEFEDQIITCWLSDEPDVQLGINRFDVDGLWLFFSMLLRCADYSSQGCILHQILCMPSPPHALVVFACSRTQEPFMVQDAAGNTPLHLAMQKQLSQIACFLIQRFPESLPILNNAGDSTFSIATRSFPSFDPCLRLMMTTCPYLVETVTEDYQLYAQLFENLLRAGDNDDGHSAVFEMLRRQPRIMGADRQTE